MGESGTLRYLPGEINTLGADGQVVRQKTCMRYGVKMDRGSWLCEPALWVQDWQTRGQLLAILNSSILLLNTKTFVAVIRQFPLLFFDMVLHARWAFGRLEADQ